MRKLDFFEVDSLSVQVGLRRGIWNREFSASPQAIERKE